MRQTALKLNASTVSDCRLNSLSVYRAVRCVDSGV